MPGQDAVARSRPDRASMHAGTRVAGRPRHARRRPPRPRARPLAGADDEHLAWACRRVEPAARRGRLDQPAPRPASAATRPARPRARRVVAAEHRLGRAVGPSDLDERVRLLRAGGQDRRAAGRGRCSARRRRRRSPAAPRRACRPRSPSAPRRRTSKRERPRRGRSASPPVEQPRRRSSAEPGSRWSACRASGRTSGGSRRVWTQRSRDGALRVVAQEQVLGPLGVGRARPGPPGRRSPAWPP